MALEQPWLGHAGEGVGDRRGAMGVEPSGDIARHPSTLDEVAVGPETLIGQIADVEITRGQANSLAGRLVTPAQPEERIVA